MDCHCLITDGLACSIPVPADKWLATGVREDMFFMVNYCGVPKYSVSPMPDSLSEQVRAKFPIKRGLTPKERFNIVSKRVNMAEKEIIKSYTFVIVFGKDFKVKSTANDGRAILRINERHFYTSMELSGSPVPINDFMQIPYANLCLSDWGKYCDT